MTFEPENALEETLVRAGTDPLARPEFYRLMMDSELFVLGRAAPQESGGRGLQIATLRQNGRDYLAAFSALSRLLAFAGPGKEHFTMAGRALFEATKGANFVLNPNAKYGKMLHTVEIAYWLDPSARARRNLIRASEARLASYRAPPGKLIETLTMFFISRQAISAAFLMEATPLDGKEPAHPLIGIETTGHWPKIAGEVSQLVEALMPGLIIDLVQIDRADGPDSASARLLEAPPFYSRTNTLN